MHTRSRGRSNLFSPSDLEKAEQAKRDKRARNRAEQQLENEPPQFEQMADPPGVHAPPQAANLAANQQNAGANPIHPPRVARQIGAGDTPNSHLNRHGITPPPVPNNNFEIKTSLISLVENSQFHGMKDEDPLKHLDKFDRLCSLQKINGVSEDGFKLRLFPFSLGGKALAWESSLPEGSVITWEQCKHAFLAKFFPTSRTAKLRNDISGFTQLNSETFSEAYERFKGYQMQCPHHGFSKENLLSTLYSGVLPRYRMLLDTASNGYFMGQDVDDGLLLVENIATSDGNYNEEYDRSDRGSSINEEKLKKEIKTLNDKFYKMISGQQKHVHFVCEDDVVEEEEETQVEEVNYINNQGGYQKGFINYKNNPNLSYRSTNVENPQDQVYPPQPSQQQGGQQSGQQVVYYKKGYPPKTFGIQQQGSTQAQAGSSSGHESDMKQMLQQLLQGEVTGASDLHIKLAEIHNKVDSSHHELTQKIEALSSKVQYLESHSSSSSKGILPGKPIPNPKEYAKAITLRSGRDLPPRTAPVSHNEDIVIQEEEDLVERNTEVSAENESEAKKPRDTSKESNKENTKRKETLFVPPPYKPPLPFPGRFKKQLVAKYKGLFDKVMAEIEVRMPILDAFMLIPPYQKFLKDAILERTKEVQGMVVLSQECSAIIQSQAVAKKLGDPGSFTLPCPLGPLSFKNCMCDLGASVSIMPMTVAKRLGFSEYKKCNFSLVLADRSIRFPKGMLEDMPLKVGNVVVPTDFIMLEMDEEPKDPLILGRPFLATAGAVIDVKRGKIELNLGQDCKLVFDINDVMKQPTISGESFYIETLDQLADEYLE
uniref:Retrotransposon gag domain-containing protein n=1 Tax=Noccaea caerulescens TaxID=107243 RepID=A0A1J3HJF2_NOCCA